MPSRIPQAAVALLGLLPVVALAVRFFFGDGLGAEPIEASTHRTGELALLLLLLTLAVTPARLVFGWRRIAPFRRTFGLLAFAYACLHFTTWLALDHFFEWAAIVEDVLERRYVTVGFAGLLCMVPLAATSTRTAVRRLGRRWVPLHRLAYVAAICGVVHYGWLVKADLLGPAVHASILAVLLGWRVAEARRRANP
ncbi:MAG: sulfoxide reductase heme-binding subunit YedZ [Deltaproteobacteria bacterium]|nr:sulfoxide reductase heme-binding subunit YedZ [Deltaproteobacteria bacterium]